MVQPIPAYMRLRISIPMPNFRMQNFDSVNLCTTRDAEFRFSQLMYQGQTLVVHKLTESKFGIRKFGIGIEIQSFMYAGIGCSSVSHKENLESCAVALKDWRCD